jgi:hypothetical protein
MFRELFFPGKQKQSASLAAGEKLSRSTCASKVLRPPPDNLFKEDLCLFKMKFMARVWGFMAKFGDINSK